jgi:hypothetical protein
MKLRLAQTLARVCRAGKQRTRDLRVQVIDPEMGKTTKVYKAEKKPNCSRNIKENRNIID